MVKKRNKSGGKYEPLTVSTQGGFPTTSQEVPSLASTKSQLWGLGTDFTPPASPGAAASAGSDASARQTSVRSDPSVVILSTPPRPSPSANTRTTTARRGLRSSPSVVIVDYKPSQRKSRKSLRASPSLVIVDGPTPISSQPPAKKARLDASSQSTSFESTFLTPSCSQQPGQTSRIASFQVLASGYMASAPPAEPSSSSSLITPPPTQVPPPSQPTPSQGKGKRKARDGEEPKEEKRAARFKPKCPQNTLDRVERVCQQRLFMIDRHRSGDELRETFSVLGSTGNVYTVVIDQVPRCNCPDALKGSHCKHILFIFLKVLRVPSASGHWYQKALLSSELEEIYAQAPLAPNCVAHSHVREAHARETGQYSGPSSQAVKKRWPTKDDDCPICYETMFGIAENGLKFCDACGNALHEECMKQWQASSLRGGKSVTCVWCRAETNLGGGAKGRKSKGAGTHSIEGYLNLASVAGLSPVRDTSTYYRGRGRGYGYGQNCFDAD